MKIFGIISLSLVSIELILMIIVFLDCAIYDRAEKDTFGECVWNFLLATFGISVLLVPAIVFIAMNL